MNRVRTERLLLLVLSGATILFVDPRGNFPVLDDWDFAIPTWNFARTGQFHFTKFTAVSLRLQVLWGALWTRLFGQDFTVLRSSTLCLMVVTVLLLHHFLVWVSHAEHDPGPLTVGGCPSCEDPSILRVALITALVLLAHPLFLWLSFTFMTEVPFITLSLAAMTLFVRAIARGDRLRFVFACALVVGSVFIRQTGVVTVVPVLVYLVAYRQRATPRWRSFAAIAFVIPIVVATLFFVKRSWISGAPGEFAMHYRMWQSVSYRLPDMITTASHYTFFTFEHSALYFLPLTVPLFALLYRRGRATALFAVLTILFLWRAISLLQAGRPLPYDAFPYCCDINGGYILNNFSVGPMTMPDVWTFHQRPLMTMLDAPRVVLTLGAAILGALLLTICLVSAWKQPNGKTRDTAIALSAMQILFATAALFLSELWTDRYSLDVAWPCVILLPLLLNWRRVRPLVLALLIAIGAFSLLGVQDYHRWAQTRARAATFLRSRGVTPEHFDAGSEYTLWLLVSPHDQRFRRTIEWKQNRDYMLAIRPFPGYTTITTFPYTSYLGWLRGSILVMHRDGRPW